MIESTTEGKSAARAMRAARGARGQGAGAPRGSSWALTGALPPPGDRTQLTAQSAAQKSHPFLQCAFLTGLFSKLVQNFELESWANRRELSEVE